MNNLISSFENLALQSSALYSSHGDLWSPAPPEASVQTERSSCPGSRGGVCPSAMVSVAEDAGNTDAVATDAVAVNSNPVSGTSAAVRERHCFDYTLRGDKVSIR